MTVAAKISSRAYNGNGVSVNFAADFRYLSTAHLAVSRVNADATVTPLVLGADYSATPGTTDAGGTVTCAVAPAAGTVLRIKRVTPRSQSTDYTTGDDFPAESHEAALDRLTMIAQELVDSLSALESRAIRAAEGQAGYTLPLPAALVGTTWVVGIDPVTGLPTLINVASLSPIPGPPGSVAGYSSDLISSSPGGAGGVRYRATLGDILDGSGTNNRADFIVARARSAWAANHGGSGAPYNYYDEVAVVGTNFNANAARLNASAAALGWFWEPKFYQGGLFGLEHQLRFMGLDGVERRPLQWFLPEDGATRGKAECSMQIDKLNFFAWDNIRIHGQWNLQNGAMDWGAGTYNNYSSNNLAIVKQLNAAGTVFLAHPFIDGDNFLRKTTPSVQVGAAEANATYGITAFRIGQCTNLPAGGHLDQCFASGAIVGSVMAFERRAQCSGDVLGFIENNGAGSATFNVQGNAASAYRINGTKVVGQQGAALPADATDLATTLTLVNAIKARMKVTGGHGLVAD